MDGNLPTIPSVLRQPLAVDFIQSRLPHIHDGFKHLPVRYDSHLKRFIYDTQAVIMPPDVEQLSPLPGSSLSPQQRPVQLLPTANQTQSLPARKLIPALRAMTFWNKILDDAMTKFIEGNSEVPNKLLKKLEYSIRGLQSWDDIYTRLQKAREEFDGEKSQFVGGIKKAYRYLIDKNDVAKQALKFVPDSQYVSPVKAAVEVLLDAAKVASDVRKVVGSSFDEQDLEKTFGKIELFLATFPDDENITLASIGLIACTLEAIEAAIVYFLSHTLTRFRQSLPVVGDGKKFKEGLLNSIGQIPAKCQELVDQGLYSHIEGTKRAMELVLQGFGSLELLEIAIGNRVEVVVQKTDLILQQGSQIVLKIDELDKSNKGIVDLVNHIFDLLLQGEKKNDMEREKSHEMMFRVERLQEDFKTYLTDCERHSAINVHSLTPAPPPQQLSWYPPQQPMPWNMSQQPQVPLQGGLYQPPGPWMTQLPAQYHPYQPSPEPRLHANTLLELLRMSSPDTNDSKAILDSEESIALKYRSHSKTIIISDQFHAWATSSTSCELLVQGDTRHDIIQAGSALSLVSAMLMRGLRRRNSFVSLVFFCRQHCESDDEFCGPSALIRSLTAQLLQQHFGNFTFRQRDINLEGLRGEDIAVLCGLFEWLVRQLPQHKTVVCVVDAVDTYETAKYEKDLRIVMDSLIGLARDPNLSVTVKIFATSHDNTVSLHEAFKDSEMSVLLLGGLISNGDEQGMMDIEVEV